MVVNLQSLLSKAFPCISNHPSCLCRTPLSDDLSRYPKLSKPLYALLGFQQLLQCFCPKEKLNFMIKLTFRIFLLSFSVN